MHACMYVYTIFKKRIHFVYVRVNTALLVRVGHGRQAHATSGRRRLRSGLLDRLPLPLGHRLVVFWSKIWSKVKGPMF
jgi:hypothetical protein